ncbi:heme peroxidase [Trichoderma arundinaceum]|uniref:Peroxidase n=1 Tax=Trichoderma arundinaceum TaxID=490622 RepID=A0A395N8Q4_TRIAR|nr:heme peroxidase [Trichoderma arundinaceum]
MVLSYRVLSTVTTLGLVASSAYAEAEYIWPSKTDLLESMLYEQQGFASGNSPATDIVPCNKVPFGAGRNGAAEWLRTAYHDMANADVPAGIGGIDASIGYELDRDENPGIGFKETLLNLAAFLTPRSSMADLIAMGALFAANGCSNGSIEIPFRAGRVDATGPGPTGVPKPEESLDQHISSFQKQGFTPQEMIGLVACGHTLGGVHGVDFPEIVTVVNDTATDDNTQTFDTTNSGFTAFDNTVAVQFVNNVTQNPLAFGHNETTRSDARIFNSDGGKEIGHMASSPSYFYKTCQDLLERMINTVPKGVTLTEPILPIAVKPTILFATINANGTMTVAVTVRVMGGPDFDSNRSLRVHFHPRSGEDCSKTNSCIVSSNVTSVSFPSHVMYGDPPLTFWTYQTSTEIPIAHGISGFDVEIIDNINGVTNSTLYTNGGRGFPFDDTILTQPKLSCSEVRYFGRVNLTVAVRDDANLDSVKAKLYLPSPLTSLTPAVGSISLDLATVGPIVGSGYTLYNTTVATGLIPFQPPNNFGGGYLRTYDLIASNATHTVEREFNMVDGLRECEDPRLGF